MATVRSTGSAARAYQCVSAVSERDRKGYLSFARSFPTLIHSAGLVQATAFALAKGHEQRLVLNDLATVMAESEALTGERLQQHIRATDNLVHYQQLTRSALTAATWIKRYAEAVLGPLVDAESVP